LGADGVIGLLTVAVIAIGAVVALAVQQAWMNHRPPSDITRIKAAMEDAARRVVDVEPDGWAPGGRYSRSWRKYRVRIRELDGQISDHTVGVEATIFGYPGFRDFSHPNRAWRI
jgi:hypothetical protein